MQWYSGDMTVMVTDTFAIGFEAMASERIRCLGQKPMAGQVISPRVEPVIVSLLDSCVSNCLLSIYTYTHRPVLLSVLNRKSFLLQ